LEDGAVTSSTTSGIVTAAGTAVAYEGVGSGPAVVLVHGLTESRRMWDPLIEPLAADHTVVGLDLPGHGESGLSPSYDTAVLVDAVGAVVAAAGIDAPLLVGHSLGAWVVTAAARSLPCRGVVNVDQRLDLSASQAAIAPLEPALRGDEASFDRVMREDFDEYLGALGDDERARIDGLRRPRQDVVLDLWAPFFELSANELAEWVRERVSGVTVPYLALHGRDPGDAYAGRLNRLIPGAIVELWPELGHYPHLVEPQRFLARLRSFEETT
jgi:pimeloyl-ACP methyl ester carboxylesterase